MDFPEENITVNPQLIIEYINSNYVEMLQKKNKPIYELKQLCESDEVDKGLFLQKLQLFYCYVANPNYIFKDNGQNDVTVLEILQYLNISYSYILEES